MSYFWCLNTCVTQQDNDSFRAQHLGFPPTINVPKFHFFGRWLKKGIAFHLSQPRYVMIWIAGHFFSKAWLVNELWLVVWNMNFIFPYIGNHNPNWRSHIFRGRYTTNQLWFMVDITCITIVFIGFINHFALFPIDFPYFHGSIN